MAIEETFFESIMFDDVLLLSRIQYALNISCHFFYPPLSIGIGFMLVIIESLYMWTNDAIYQRMGDFWIKIFAVTFALGVGTGLVQAFAFGTNWSRFTNFAGNVMGGILASEALFAFLLESGFLGVLLFGRKRFSKLVHYIAVICVTVGAHLSGVLIIMVNSWMQTPTGFKIETTNGMERAVITDVWKVIFNPSAIDRSVHTLVACWLAGIFMVLGIAAFYMLKKRFLQVADRMFKIAIISACIVLVIQLISADSSARIVAKYQPAKLAAMEGVFTTKEYTPMTLVGWVDTKKGKTYGLKVPGALSLLTHRNAKTPVTGLDKIKKADRPPVQLVFQMYHLMIACWGIMFLLATGGLFLYKKGKIMDYPWFLKVLVGAIFIPSIAIQAGWYTAEVGRQPWLVYGVYRTAQGVCPFITASELLGSLAMFSCLYIVLFILFLYLIIRKISHGPVGDDLENEAYRNPYPGE